MNPMSRRFPRWEYRRAQHPRVRRTEEHGRGRTRDAVAKSNAGEPYASVLTMLASAMAACRMWIDPCGSTHDTIHLQAFHIDVADPYLDTGEGP